MTTRPIRTGVVLFEGFELLDVAGPLECLGNLPEHFDVVLVGPQAGPVSSAQGPTWHAGNGYGDAEPVDLVVVPGGIGTRTLAADATFGAWLADWSAPASTVTSVCTGAGLLAAAGLLDGYRATTNKSAFEWVRTQGPEVEWVPKARWVRDRDRWTSGGVAAGIDMTLALIADFYDETLASNLADRIEYDWHRDAEWDPFAVRHGLVES